jgi:hypothetical protein
VYLATEAGGEGLLGFLDDHACLLHRLRGWTVVVIGAKHSAGFDACRSAFDAYVKRDPERERIADLTWYFAKRRIVEQGDLSQISVQDIGASGSCDKPSRRRVTRALYDELAGDRPPRGRFACR